MGLNDRRLSAFKSEKVILDRETAIHVKAERGRVHLTVLPLMMAFIKMTPAKARLLIEALNKVVDQAEQPPVDVKKQTQP